MSRLEVAPVLLKGDFASLEPITLDHAVRLAKHVDPTIFRWMAADMPASQNLAEVQRYIRSLLALDDTLAFVICTPDDECVGVTTYMDIRPFHRGLEIGRTWVTPKYQGCAINPQCKLLLLEHAFEILACERVQLKTDGRNLQSQRAIEKLGAQKEGVLRRHTIMPDGFVRDTVMYSILPSEWPSVKQGLIERLETYRTHG